MCVYRERGWAGVQSPCVVDQRMPHLQGRHMVQEVHTESSSGLICDVSDITSTSLEDFLLILEGLKKGS